MIEGIFSVDLIEWDDCVPSRPEAALSSPGFHEKILLQGSCSHQSSMKNNVFYALQKYFFLDQRVQRAFDNALVRSRPERETCIGGEIGFETSWGGKEKPSFSGSISGHMSDNKGNKAKATVSMNGDGSRTFSASASTERRKPSK